MYRRKTRITILDMVVTALLLLLVFWLPASGQFPVEGGEQDHVDDQHQEGNQAVAGQDEELVLRIHALQPEGLEDYQEGGNEDADQEVLKVP